MDSVFAGDDIGDGAAAGLSSRLAGGLGGWGHFCREDLLANAHHSSEQLRERIANTAQSNRIGGRTRSAIRTDRSSRCGG